MKKWLHYMLGVNVVLLYLLGIIIMIVGVVLTNYFGSIEDELYEEYMPVTRQLKEVQMELRDKSPEKTARVVEELKESHATYKKMIEEEIAEIIKKYENYEGHFRKSRYFSEQEQWETAKEAIRWRQNKIDKSAQEMEEYIAERKKICDPDIINHLKSREKVLLRKKEYFEKHLYDVWDMSGNLFWGRCSFWIVFVGLWVSGWSSRLGFWNAVIDVVIVAFPLAMLIGSFLSAFLGFM